ncbi:MAG: zinc ribbon domain-containing protein [Oscillospiraceae bacterium]|nr:zinc ribbon domain-containing protein [Oscillospiraceae bacterium]
MSFCPQCGAQTGAGMRFCLSCGAALAAAAVPVDTVAAPGSDYRLILISCGGCSRTQAQSLLRDTLGYTATEARTLTAEAPIEIACALTGQQALYLAQLFSEYGMQLGVTDGAGNYVDISDRASSSVFTASGALLATVTATLATIGAANRVRSFLRWERPAPPRYLFAPRYRSAPPPPRPKRPAPPPQRMAPGGRGPRGKEPGRPAGGRGPGKPTGGRGPGGPAGGRGSGGGPRGGFGGRR